MVSRSLVEQIRARWREFCREPSAMFFVVLMPILWMLILGWAFSGDQSERFGVGWNEKLTAESPSLLESLSDDPRIVLVPDSAENLVAKLKRGQVVVIIDGAPRDNVPPNSAGALQMQFDKSNPESTRASWLVNDIAQRHAGRQDRIQVEESAIAIPGTRYVEFLIPGLLALTIMTSSLFGTGMTIVSNRRENILKRYLATPMQPYEYIVSHIFGRFFVLVVEVAAILLVGWVIFSFVPGGNWLELFLFIILGAASFTSLALLCGSRTKNIPAMNGMVNLIILPMMLVAGIWFSRSGFPEWLNTIASYLPLTALADGIRGIALEGLHLHQLSFEISLLAVYFVICTVLTKRMFKWY